MTGLELPVVLVRLTFYGATVMLFGIQCFMSLLAPARLGEVLSKSAEQPLLWTAIVALLASLAGILVTAMVTAGDGMAVFDADTIKALLLQTTVGHALLIRGGLAIGMVLLLKQAAPHPMRTAWAAHLLASASLSGHARMDAGWREPFHLGNDVVHLLAGGFWLGSLCVLPFCLAKLKHPTLCAEARIALQRFSTYGHAAVALVILTGFLNAALVLGGWPAGQSRYSWVLLTKAATVGMMTSIAIANRYVFVPWMRTSPAAAVTAIRRGTYTELVLGAAVLILVALLGTMEPG